MTKPVAIVTGASRGLGLGAAHALAREGFDLALIATRESSAETETILSDLAELGATARYYALDITDLARHQVVLDAIAQDFGRIDTLVNNAGIADRPLTDVLELSVEGFDRGINVNLRGTFFLTQAFVNLVLAQGWNKTNPYTSVIIVSSIAAEMVSTVRASYNVSKAGLAMVTKLFAKRLGGEGIFVHEIRPGFMKTEMTASAGNTIVDDWIRDGRVPDPRWGQSEDFGNAVATLASGRLSYMTGQVLWIDGGLHIPPAP